MILVNFSMKLNNTEDVIPILSEESVKQIFNVDVPLKAVHSTSGPKIVLFYFLSVKRVW